MSSIHAIRSRVLRTVITTSALLLFFCGVAQATSTRYYGELLTSNQTVFGPKNVRSFLDTSSSNIDPLNILLNGTTVAGGGIGNGYVSAGSPIVYSHTFAPTANVDQILGATVAVGVLDDQLFDRSETAQINVDDAFWKRGFATVNLFSGDVTAALIAGSTPNEVRMAVLSTRGDFNIQLSYMGVAYTTLPSGGTSGATPGAPVPEPTAAVLFIAGFAAVHRATRRA